MEGDGNMKFIAFSGVTRDDTMSIEKDATINILCFFQYTSKIFTL
jgi:hypothetical protein